MSKQEQLEALAANPEAGLGDLLKFGQALTEAILSGATELPAMDFKIVGKQVELGPCPLKIK